MKRKSVSGFLAALTFLLATVVMQLYFNKDHYFAMTKAKGSFTMIVFIAAVAALLAGFVERLKKRQEWQKMTLLDWCILVFGCSSMVTCVLSKAPDLTLVGSKGMYVGAFTYVAGMITYFAVSRNLTADRRITAAVLAAWAVIFIWTIANQCGTDVFGMHENMQPGTQWTFVASMGNINSASTAFATVIPFAVMLLFFAYGESRRYLLAAFCAAGFLATYMLDCEGMLIGFLVMMPFAVIAAMSNVRRLKLALTLLLAVGLTLTVFHFLCVCTVVMSQKGLVSTLASHWAGESLSVFAALLLFLNGRNRLKSDERTLRIVRSVLAWACVAVLAGFVCVAVVKSTYDPDFGSWRGAVWKGCVWSFRLFTPLEMIFGQGSGMFADNVTMAWSMLFDKKSDFLFATCHNSLLQALLGNGIVGLLCLLTGVYALLRDWRRDLRAIVLRPMPKYESIHNVQYSEIIRVASFTSVIGYFGTSLVASVYPHTVILLFAMLALYRSTEPAKAANVGSGSR